MRRSLEDLTALVVVDADQGERKTWRGGYWAPAKARRGLWRQITDRRGRYEPSSRSSPSGAFIVDPYCWMGPTARCRSVRDVP